MDRINIRSILVTGGTGSFGRAFVAEVLQSYPNIERLVVLSRDELKQYEMAQIYSPARYPSMRYFLGDIRDRNRLYRAFKGIDVVVHAAALKQVPAAEYNPIEFIHTNVLGSENVIEAAVDAGVKIVIALSTDKATAPVNMYGATKLCSDKLFAAANHYTGRETRFSIVRYGNVMGSRGSVIPHFLDQAKQGVLPITDKEMTRFNITLRDGVDLVLWTMKHMIGGEIFVPKIPSYRLVDVANAIGPNCKQEIIGIRPGEKVHEELISNIDSHTTVDVGKYYAILPVTGSISIDTFIKEHSASLVEPGFSYHSGRNTKFLTVGELRMLIREEIDSKFEPR